MVHVQGQSETSIVTQANVDLLCHHFNDGHREFPLQFVEFQIKDREFFEISNGGRYFAFQVVLPQIKLLKIRAANAHRRK